MATKVKNNTESEKIFKDKCLKIYESLVSGKGLNHIIQIASDLMGNPVSLSDSSFRHLAYSSNMEVNDPIWNDIILYGYRSYETVKKFNKEKVIERINESDLPILVNTGIGQNMSRILGKVLISGKPVAYLGVFEVNRKLTDEDINLSQVICSVLSVQLSKDPAISSLTGSLKENLIIDLLNGTSLDEIAMKERLQSSLWIPKSNFYILYIPIKEDSVTNIEYLRFYLEKLSPYFNAVYLHDSILLLMNFSREEEIEGTWKEIQPLLASYGLKAGVSFRFSCLEKLKSFYNQAKNSYNIGIIADKEAYIYYFNDYYSLYLLNQLETKICLQDYCHKGILKLYDFDKQNSTYYCYTLYEYLNHSCSLTNTSKKLYIHKNTMIHRLERIREISGINEIEAEDKFKIYLTYKILDYMALFFLIHHCKKIV